MDELKDVIKTVITNLKKKEKQESDILKTWEKTAGKKASKHTKPVFLKKKRLVVNISDSSWLYKLTLDKRALIKKFNYHLKDPKKKIKELQFKIASM